MGLVNRDEKKTIITGPPSSGKTSLINELQKLNYPVFHEIAREIIKEELLINSDDVPWKNMTTFSQKVIQRQIRDYLNAKNISFFDRGIPDVLAYLNWGDFDSFLELNDAIKNFPYHNNVFITPPWVEIYENDSERKESFQEAIDIHGYLSEAYVSLGYNVIEIPKMELHKRVQFIIDRV